MEQSLQDALNHPLWLAHKPAHRYLMDGKGSWQLYYYPIMGDGKTQEEYTEPRALMRSERRFKDGKFGTDLREVPLRYIDRILNKDT